MYNPSSSGNTVGGIPSANSRFLLFLLLQWIGWGLNSCSLATVCPTNCGGLRETTRFPFGANPVCGAPRFVLNCSSASASAAEEPLWSPLDHPSLRRTFSVLEIHVDPANFSKGSALVSLAPFPAHPACSNNSYSGINSTLFNFSSAIHKLTTPGGNWTISQNTSFLFVGCRARPNYTWNPAITEKSACASGYIRNCTSQQPLCFIVTDTKSVESLAAEWDCEYFTSFVQNGPMVSEWHVLAIEWSMDQNSTMHCISCLRMNQGCINDNGTDPSNGSCAKCEGSACSSLAPAPAPAPDVSLLSPKEKKRRFLIAVAGGSLGIVLLLLLLVAWARKCKWKFLQVLGIQLRRSVHRNSSKNMIDTSGNSKPLEALVEKMGPIPSTVYSYRELQDATSAFSDRKLLGDGGFGSVYEGRLYSGQKVAVKRLYQNSCRRLEQFMNEIHILSCLQHPNLIKLLGYCYHQDPKDLLLVYEFASHGTLADDLHGGGDNKAKGRLTWQMRLQVALETAVALEYLHFEVKPPIFHRDVKSANILLDDNFHAKLADFGLSRLAPLQGNCHVSTAPQGTPGYVDPDYHQSYQLTDKSDVYSFGVVLMEIVSGKMAVDMSRDKRDINLSHLALSMIQKGAIEELIDPHLDIDRCPIVRHMACGVAEMAFQCLAAEKDDRPTMKEVVAELARIQGMGIVLTSPPPGPPFS